MWSPGLSVETPMIEEMIDKLPLKKPSCRHKEKVAGTSSSSMVMESLMTVARGG